MPISTYQISIITPRADAKMQSMYISVHSRTRGHICMYIIQKGRCQPPADPRRRGAARRGAPAARGPVLTTLISALRRRRTSSCAARYAYFMRVATPRSFLVPSPHEPTTREIRNEYRDYRQRGIISHSRCYLPLGFLRLGFPTTRFIFSRICI